ncbi:hypothetical protein M7I_0426 [Glarea lozoyensis 74030]|uniref:Uncharacterized protein n=1 Tax=Glarea lozoyensis (strain ATCC 74030 / MF5533) TaxID=1104152 RepID=H0EDB8_GLAL7|nr:hypothetical protein M7I_0426 [Glarea lozoyensis 74030]
MSVVVPPRRSWGKTVSADVGRLFSPSSNGFSASAEGSWNANKESKTPTSISQLHLESTPPMKA